MVSTSGGSPSRAGRGSPSSRSPADTAKGPRWDTDGCSAAARWADDPFGADQALAPSAILEQLGDPVWVLGRDLKLLAANQAARSLPPTSSGVLAFTFAPGARLGGEAVPSFESIVQRVFDTGEPLRHVLARADLASAVDRARPADRESTSAAPSSARGSTSARPSGLGSSLHWMLSFGPVRGASGAVTGVVVKATEIGRARLDASINDDLLSVAAHELRTPLTPITILLQALERRARAGTIDVESVVRTRHQVARLTQLIADLLDVSRSEEGRLEIERRTIDLGAIVARCTEEFRSIVDKHPVSVHAERGLFVEGDEGRLSHALTSLLESALRCAARGDAIQISATRGERDRAIVQVVCHPAAPKAGDGAPEPRAEPSGARLQNAGLGVYVARAVALAHGGDASFTVPPNGGPTFRLFVPLSIEAPSLVSRSAEPVAPLPQAQ